MSGSAAQVLTADTTDSVADLRAMLANQSVAHQTLLDEHNKLKKQFSAEAKKVRDRDTRIDGLEAKIEALQSDIDDWESGETLLKADRDIEELACVRALLKKGEVERAREGLERLLDGLDTCWRNRTGIVVGQGALL